MKMLPYSCYYWCDNDIPNIKFAETLCLSDFREFSTLTYP